jgi:3',5'-cyclic AMP phosphodiesterase CpdA
MTYRPRTIFHLSDVHFGERHAPDRAEALLEAIRRSRPDVVAVSGDLTRRARPHEFRAAREFLERIDRPKVVVPGNHDVPLWNPVARFLGPMRRWQRWLGIDPSAVYATEGLAVVGVDTTRSFTFSGGKVTSDDHALLEERICSLPSDVCKVVVGHHPLAVPPGFRRHGAVAGATETLRFLSACGVDVVLSGHLHVSHAASSEDLHPALGRHIVLVQAGTATTLRGRGAEHEQNSFNLVTVTADAIEVTHLLYGEEGFEPAGSRRFPRQRSPGAAEPDAAAAPDPAATPTPPARPAGTGPAPG